MSCPLAQNKHAHSPSPVQAEGNAAMRGGAQFKGLKQEAKLLLRLCLAQPYGFKYLELQIFFVDAQTATCTDAMKPW